MLTVLLTCITETITYLIQTYIKFLLLSILFTITAAYLNIDCYVRRYYAVLLVYFARFVFNTKTKQGDRSITSLMYGGNRYYKTKFPEFFNNFKNSISNLGLKSTSEEHASKVEDLLEAQNLNSEETQLPKSPQKKLNPEKLNSNLETRESLPGPNDLAVPGEDLNTRSFTELESDSIVRTQKRAKRISTSQTINRPSNLQEVSRSSIVSENKESDHNLNSTSTSGFEGTCSIDSLGAGDLPEKSQIKLKLEPQEPQKLAEITSEAIEEVNICINAIIDDNVTKCFQAQHLTNWNLLSRSEEGIDTPTDYKILTAYWLGFVIRYVFIFPYRLCLCFISLSTLGLCAVLLKYGFVEKIDEKYKDPRAKRVLRFVRAFCLA